MHRFSKIITLATIGSAFAAAPAFAAPGHLPTVESPKALTIDVPAVATPAIATPKVRTPGPRLCAGVQSITLPASAGARVTTREASSPDSTSAVDVCAVVPSVTVRTIAVQPINVDLKATTVVLPVSLAADGSGAKSSAGDGVAAASAGDSDNHTGIRLETGASDINVDVAPHL